MKLGVIEKYGVFDSRKKFPVGKETEFRAVESFEFEYLISCDKDATSFIEKKSIRLTPQMLVVRKPGQKCKSKLHFKCYCIHLTLAKDNPYYEELLALPDFYLSVNADVYREIFETFTYHAIADEARLYDDYSLSKLIELIYHLKKDAPFNREISKGLKKNDPRVAKAIEYMERHFDEKITLQLLGEMTGYTPNHFQRLFTLVTGMSPQKFLENVRLRHAKYLLAGKDMSISQIAYACGFSSQAYFTLLFKRTTMLTPREFRDGALSAYPD